MASYISPVDPVIDDLWERRGELTPADEAARKAVTAAVDLLASGYARAAFIDDATDEVVVDERAKRAILLSFRVLDLTESAAGDFHYHDRMPLKRRPDGARGGPGATARRGAYMRPGCGRVAAVMPN